MMLSVEHAIDVLNDRREALPREQGPGAVEGVVAVIDKAIRGG